MRDPDFERKKQAAQAYIGRRLGETVGGRDEHKDVASEVAGQFGILLTPGEVKDIHTSGWN